MSWLDEVNFDSSGLIPVVAQDARTGELLMLAWANREALELTIDTGAAHYWSRSRGSMWKKGETSGHLQDVTEVRIDCDGDAVLYRVHQTGPACHTLERSCFHRRVDGGELVQDIGPGHILARMADVVAERARTMPAESYTTYLFEQGLDKILKKLGEESTETVIAAKNGDNEELRSEAADLLFHLVVLLEERKLPLEDVWSELEKRFGQTPRALKNLAVDHAS
jgi:phosphoribosyl-AMP cyclohydrolase / phosphoribosyl-ATP pyrophosphohydrolase